MRKKSQNARAQWLTKRDCGCGRKTIGQWPLYACSDKSTHRSFSRRPTPLLIPFKKCPGQKSDPLPSTPGPPGPPLLITTLWSIDLRCYVAGKKRRHHAMETNATPLPQLRPSSAKYSLVKGEISPECSERTPSCEMNRSQRISLNTVHVRWYSTLQILNLVMM